jgi:hypothetical protein
MVGARIGVALSDRLVLRAAEAPDTWHGPVLYVLSTHTHETPWFSCDAEHVYGENAEDPGSHQTFDLADGADWLAAELSEHFAEQLAARRRAFEATAAA